MRVKKVKTLSGEAAAAIALLAVWLGGAKAQQPATGENIRIDSNDIGGVVTSVKGPEAGVWVIAETTDLATRFIRIVATDVRAAGRMHRRSTNQEPRQ